MFEANRRAQKVCDSACVCVREKEPYQQNRSNQHIGLFKIEKAINFKKSCKKSMKIR